jgi:hypothetical protein
MLLTAAYLFLLALLFALHEIEIEGRFGWAEQLPTWYRTTGFLRFLLVGRKPLTGYHLSLHLFLFVAFHLCFVLGTPWSLAAELQIISLLVLFLMAADVLWFVFNPHYGLKNFKKEKIWWHRDSLWPFGLFPADYAMQLSLSAILSYLAALRAADLAIFSGWLETAGALILLILLASPLSPLYKRWYERMRKKDDRQNARIFH